MKVDERLKDLMQLCADVQDGFSEAAMLSDNPDLASLFQADAVQWNGFADQIFPVLLSVNHTSPDAYWTADPDRPWMNADEETDVITDLFLCEECMRGLRLAQGRLLEATNIELPQARKAVLAQVSAVEDQISKVVQFVSDTDRLTA
jgi:hypothetical protein